MFVKKTFMQVTSIMCVHRGSVKVNLSLCTQREREGEPLIVYAESESEPLIVYTEGE